MPRVDFALPYRDSLSKEHYLRAMPARKNPFRREKADGVYCEMECEELVLDTRIQVRELIDSIMHDIEDVGSISPVQPCLQTYQDATPDLCRSISTTDHEELFDHSATNTNSPISTTDEESEGWRHMLCKIVPSFLLFWLGKDKGMVRTPSASPSSSPDLHITIEDPAISTTYSKAGSTRSSVSGSHISPRASRATSRSDPIPTPRPKHRSEPTRYASVFPAKSGFENDLSVRPPTPMPSPQRHNGDFARYWYSRCYRDHDPSYFRYRDRLYAPMVPVRSRKRDPAVSPEQLWSDKFDYRWPTPDPDHVQILREPLMPPGDVHFGNIWTS